jgi:hypothetical protein
MIIGSDGKLKLWGSRPEFFFDDPDFTSRYIYSPIII